MIEKIIQPHLDPRGNHGFIKICPFKVTAFDRNRLDDVKPLTEVSKMERIPTNMSLVVKSLPVGLCQPKQERRKGIPISYMFSLSSSCIMVRVYPLSLCQLVACFPGYLPSILLLFGALCFWTFAFVPVRYVCLFRQFCCFLPWPASSSRHPVFMVKNRSFY